MLDLFDKGRIKVRIYYSCCFT